MGRPNISVSRDFIFQTLKNVFTVFRIYFLNVKSMSMPFKTLNLKWEGGGVVRGSILMEDPGSWTQKYWGRCPEALFCRFRTSKVYATLSQMLLSG